METNQALLNVTWNGQNGDNPEPVSWDLSDAEILVIAQESIRSGHIPGIRQDEKATLTDFVVDRFSATTEPPIAARLMVRPKVPFGSQ
jgi:hypothetical protein